MNEKDPWFVRERAYAYSALLLTAHGDMIVQQQHGTNDGIDLLVEILKKGKRAMRVFGVQVKGCVSLPSIRDASQCFETNRTMGVEFDLPVCAFLIDVKKNEGYLTWVVEPRVEDGEPRLEPCEEETWKPLSAATLKEITNSVTAWYDALRPVKA